MSSKTVRHDAARGEPMVKSCWYYIINGSLWCILAIFWKSERS